MILRVVLLMLVATASSAIIFMEQPVSSDQVLPLHGRFSWLVNEVIYAACHKGTL